MQANAGGNDSESEQIFLELEQRHFSLKREHDAVCYERDSIKGNHILILNLNYLETIY